MTTQQEHEEIVAIDRDKAVPLSNERTTAK